MKLGTARTALVLALPVAVAVMNGCALMGESDARRTFDEVLAEPQPVHAARELDALRAPLVDAAPSASEPGAAPFENTERLDLNRALALARRTSEQLRSSGEDLHQAYLARLQAFADLLPQVTFRQSYFREENDLPGQTGDGDIRFGALLVEQRTSRFEGRMPLFYLSGYMALMQAQSVIDLAEARLRAEQLLVDQATTAIFYTALKAATQIDTLEAARDRDLEREREIEARAATGLARRTEVLFVKTDLSRTEAGLADARERLSAARGQLAIAIGAPLGDPITAPLDEPRLPVSLEPARLGERALPELVDQAFSHRPDLAAMRAQIDVAAGARDVALGDYAPRLDVSSNSYLHRDGSVEDVDWDVTVDLSAPIFEGLRTTTRLREAQSKQRQAELLYRAQARAVADDVTGAYHALRASTASRASREESVKSADENFRLLEAEYRLGLASNLELVTAQQDLTTARLLYENERLDEQRLAYELAFLLGGIERVEAFDRSLTEAK